MGNTQIYNWIVILSFFYWIYWRKYETNIDSSADALFENDNNFKYIYFNFNYCK